MSEATVSFQVKGQRVLIDRADMVLVAHLPWHLLPRPNGRGYYVRAPIWPRKGSIVLHRLLLAAPPGKEVDHINGEGLDNRRANLRICDGLQNRWNARTPRTNTSGYMGVQWRKRDQKWEARYRDNGKIVRVGYFATREEAAAAWRDAVTKARGEFQHIPDAHAALGDSQ